MTALSVEAKNQALSARHSNPRLAAVYEALNPSAADTAFYLDVAGGDPQTILDMGCGTGLLACELAKRGHRVTGADPAAAMLDYARRRPGGADVAWGLADAAGLRLAARFDLVVMTGHVVQLFLDDAEIRAGLRNLHRHLAPGGRVAFETRNPALQAWQDWLPERSRRSVEVPGIGPVESHSHVTSILDQIVSFDLHFGFADGRAVVTRNSLRFITQAELAVILAETGFADVQWFGDRDRSALGPTSPEIIVVAARF